MQTLIPQFRHIPRAIFTVLAFSASTVAGVAGREHFSVILSNFLAVVSFAAVAKQLFDRSPEKMAYWVAFWIVILVEEHYIFRQNNGALGGYDMHAYDSPNRRVSSFGLGQSVRISDHCFTSRLPVGLAAAYVNESWGFISY